MRILEHGQEQARTLLFFPCTAEPVWAFEATIALLAQRWHVFQVVFDGQQPEYPGDFTSVEQSVEAVTEYLKNHDVVRLDAAYGCSLGGACLTRFIRRYFPQIQFRAFLKMAHAELVIVHPEKFCRYAEEFLNPSGEE